VTDDLGTGSSDLHRRVTFDDRNENYRDAEEVAASASIPTEEAINTEGGVDGDDFPHPSTEHRERITWHLAPSRILIRTTEERYRESYDMDLFPFQAGSYASDEEETDYIESNLDGNLIDGVK